MLTHMLTDPGIIFELLEKAGAKAVVYDPCLEFLTAFSAFPKICLTDIDNKNWDTVLPPVEQLPSGSDVCFNYLTSGSTSGSPKIVPLTQEFVSTYYKAQFNIWLQGRRSDIQDVFLARGSICSVAPMIRMYFHISFNNNQNDIFASEYLGGLYTRSCIVKPSKPRVSTEELLNMVNTCGLNHMGLYGTYLSPHIQAAKRDPAILKLLQGMRSISYGGVPVSIAEDDWCFQNGIPLIVSVLFFVLVLSSSHVVDRTCMRLLNVVCTLLCIYLVTCESVTILRSPHVICSREAGPFHPPNTNRVL
jgi:hypothetical protein